MEKTKLPAEIVEAIKNTNLAYLYAEVEGYHLPLTSDRDFDLYDGCLLRSTTLKASLRSHMFAPNATSQRLLDG